VRDGVAHHVHERIPQRRQHVRVEAHLAARSLENDALAERLGCIAHGALERRKHGLSRDQPKSMRDVANLDKLPIDAIEVHSKAALKAIEA